MAFKKRAKVATIELPVGDKTYTIHSPSVEVGLMIQGVTEGVAALQAGDEEAARKIFERTGAKVEMNDEEEAEFFDMVLGEGVHAEMTADGVDHVTMQRVLGTAITWVLQGQAAAEQVWNEDEVPDAAPKSSKKKPTNSTPKT